MHYSNVCSNEESVADRFAMQLFSEKFLALDGHPSHKRYVQYFANLISGATKVNPAPIRLQTISFYQFPMHKSVVLKIYERMKPVYSSEKLLINDAHAQLDFGDEGLSLRGDLLVKCFEKTGGTANGAVDDRHLLFQCQFNTCALEFQPRQSQLTFYTPELDSAGLFANERNDHRTDGCLDPTIDGQACIEFNFVPGESRSRSSSLKRQQTPQLHVAPAAANKEAAPPVARRDPQQPQRAQSVGAEAHRLSGHFSRVDSYENFDRPEDDRSLSLSLGASDPALPFADSPKNAAAIAPPPPAASTGASSQSTRDRGPNGEHTLDLNHNHRPLERHFDLHAFGISGERAAKHQSLNSATSSDHTSSSTVPSSTSSASTQPAAATPNAVGNQTDGADSGIGSDSPKNSKLFADTPKRAPMPPVVPPAVPPKPRHGYAASEPPAAQSATEPESTTEDEDALMRASFEDENSTIGRERSVLPTGLRSAPTRQSEENPRAGAVSGSQIGPDLVAKGRYDPNSKCFSYVPAKSLKEHYRAPKKPPPRRPSVEPAKIEIPDTPEALKDSDALLRDISSASGSLQRRAETPKWDEEIARIAGDLPTESDFKRKAAEEKRRQRAFDFSPFAEDELLERPQVVEHAKRADRRRTPPRRRFDSFGRDGNSEMDELCDPDFYLTYSNNATPTPDQQRRSQSVAPYGSQRPPERKPFKTISQRDLEELNDIIDYSTKLPPTGRSFTPKPAHSDGFERDAYRHRNSRSVNALTQRGPRLSSTENYDPTRQAEDPDDWLRNKLNALRHKRGNEPMSRQQQRRQVEEDLLEELKNTSASNPPPPANVQQRTSRRDLESAAHRLAPQAARPANSRPTRELPAYNPPTHEPRRGAQPWEYDANIDELRRANRENMDHTFRSRTPNYYDAQGTFDRAAAVRQRSATPNILMPTGNRTLQLARDPRSARCKTAGPPVDPLDFEPLGRGAVSDAESSDYRTPAHSLPRQQPTRPYSAQQLDWRAPQSSRNHDVAAELGPPVRPGDLSYRPTAQSAREPQQRAQPAGNQRPVSSGTPFDSYGYQPPHILASASQQRRGQAGTPTGGRSAAMSARQKPPTPPPTGRARERSASPATLRSPLTGEKKPQIVLDSERQYRERLEREAALYGTDPNSSTTPAPLAPPPAANGGPNKPYYLRAAEQAAAEEANGGNGVYRRVLPPGVGERVAASAAQRQRNANSRLNDEYSDDDAERALSDFHHRHPHQDHRTSRDIPTPSSAATTKSILKRSQAGSRDDASYGYSYGTGSTSGYHYYGGGTIDSVSSQPEIYASPTPPAQRRHADQRTSDAEESADYATTGGHAGRSETPQFPIGRHDDNETPLPFHPLLYHGAQNGHPQQPNGALTSRSGSPRSMYYGAGGTHSSRRSSLTSDVGEVIHHHPVFMRDTSKYWYKPTISREEAIAMLKDKEPGTFVVRDSNSFPGAFGLALKVAQPPAGVPTTDGTELVRHFLIEPSPKGVKLKGCSNEPVFGTLAALIYQHSITPMALPAKLILPDFDPAETPEHLNANQALLERGAACNVTYICSLDTESLTGPEAVRRAVSTGLAQLTQRSLRAIPVHFKVSSQGITLTDNTRSLFFRRHYPVTTVTFAGIDPESRLFDNNNASQLPSTYIRQAPMFGFVARKSASSLENACHVFAELDPEQPASAVVRFITNVMMTLGRQQQQQIHRATAGV
ncbi:hypothetical protein M3Y99_01047900 [Aphelenchoides fujianensis]|nr:hypothetical protein M3Y99_01047900 [Aphelenchoides fujianensis]